jgi:hypothetical protein
VKSQLKEVEKREGFAERRTHESRCSLDNIKGKLVQDALGTVVLSRQLALLERQEMPMELAKKLRGLKIDNIRRVLKDEDAVEDFWSYYLTDAFPEHQDMFAKKIKKDWTNMDKSKYDMNYVNYLNKVKLNLNPATEKKKYLKSFIKIGNKLTNVIESNAVKQFKKNKGVIMQNIEVFNHKLNEMYESINKDSGHQKNSTKGIPKKILEKQREYETHKNAN